MSVSTVYRFVWDVDRRLRERARAVGRRQPAEVGAEEELRHEPEKEDGHRVDHDSEQAATAVEPRVPIASGNEAQEDTHDDGDDHGEERQLEGRHAVLVHDVANLTAVRGRDPEVQGHDVAEVVDVLDEDRAVVAQLVLDPLDLCLGHPAAERGGDRVAGRDPHEQEDEREQDEQHRHHEQEPREQVLP